jgi:predicted ArsR family transcriptional regulator
VINLNFLGATRLQILLLLRRAPRTIADLAESVRLTPNAVRSHVVALERDRLVEPLGRRSGVRKPAVLYTVSEAADGLFAKPYAQVLGALIGQVRERFGHDEVVMELRAVGTRLAVERKSQVAHLGGREKIEGIARLFNDLGGLVEVEEHDHQFVLRGYSCPLVAIVGDNPEVCQISHALVEGLVGHGSVQEVCQRGEKVSCRFEIDLTSEVNRS